MVCQTVTVWDIIKRFLIGWTVAGMILVVASCVKHGDLIVSVFLDSTWAWINALMPAVIMLFGIGLVIKSTFR